MMSDSIKVSNKIENIIYVSCEQLCFYLAGQSISEYVSHLKKGIEELATQNLITTTKQSNTSYLIDIEKIYVNTDKQFFVMIEDWEVRKILLYDSIPYKSKRIPLLRYFISMISTLDNTNLASGTKSQSGKVGYMTIDQLADNAHLSKRSAIRYNTILEDLKLIYIYRTNDKLMIDKKLKQIRNIYSRYIDRKFCISLGKDFESRGYNHQVVTPRKNKMQADHNRSLGAKYNALLNWYDSGTQCRYTKDEVQEIYEYVKNCNQKLYQLIEEKEHCSSTYTITQQEEEYINGLKNQIRDKEILLKIMNELDTSDLQNKKE